MMLFRMAWLNIWRNRRRTMITAASVFFAVLMATIMRSATLGVYDSMIDNFVTFSSGYVQVHQKGYWEDKTIDNSFVPPADMASRVPSGTEKILPRLESFALASGAVRTKGTMVSGIDPLLEKPVMRLHEKLIAGTYPLKQDADWALVAEGLARHLKVGVNDTLVLIGQGYRGSSAAGRFRIAGIVQLGSPQLNDNMVYLPLRRAQLMYGADSLVTSLSVVISQPGATGQAARNLRASFDTTGYEVMTWMQMFPELDQFIRADSSGHIIIIGILYLIISFGIFGTLLMMAVERTHEFGILVALGMHRRKIALMLMIESMYLTLLGCALGMLCGYLLVNLYASHPIQLTGQIREMYLRYGIEPVISLSSRSEVFTYQGAAILIIGLVLSLYPGWRVMKLKPVQAINS